MKKRFWLLLTAVLLSLGFISARPAKVNAAPWGAKTVFTTPKKTRGTWYFKQGKKIKHFKITAHTVNGTKLYKALKGKTEKKWITKLIKADKKSHYKLADKVGLMQSEAYSLKYKGAKGFNANGWLAGGGDGSYYVPVKRNVKGKKVSALRVGEGADNYLKYYAYKNRKLAK